MAYRNVMAESLVAKSLAVQQPNEPPFTNTVRLLPISGGIFAGAFLKDMAQLTYQSIMAGYEMLPAAERVKLTSMQFHMCVYSEAELPAFYEAGFGAGGVARSDDLSDHQPDHPVRSLNTAAGHNTTGWATDDEGTASLDEGSQLRAEGGGAGIANGSSVDLGSLGQLLISQHLSADGSSNGGTAAAAREEPPKTTTQEVLRG